MSAPRVLLSGVLLGQPMGGVRRHAAELLPRVGRALAEEGGGLTVLEGEPPIPFPLPECVERIASKVPWRPPLVRAKLEGKQLKRALIEASEVGRAFDLVHVGHLPAPTKLGVPYAITIHDLRSLSGEHSPFTRRLIARQFVGSAVERAAAVVTVSETVRDELLARFRLDPSRVHVVPNAADHFDPLPRSPGAEAPLVHVGHVEPRKNLELLVRALAADAELPPLLLAGAPKNDEDERLRGLAAELGVGDRVTFAGPVPDDELPSLFARAACIVLPSKLEGFGIVALEAQRARVPLAISRIGAHVEVAGEATPSFAPDDPAECARAMRQAIDAGAETVERGVENAARYRWDESAERLLDAWRGAAAG